MNFLASNEPIDTDSDDGDYIPPQPTNTTRRKTPDKPTGLVSPSDSDDDDIDGLESAPNQATSTTPNITETTVEDVQVSKIDGPSDITENVSSPDKADEDLDPPVYRQRFAGYPRQIIGAEGKALIRRYSGGKVGAGGVSMYKGGKVGPVIDGKDRQEKNAGDEEDDRDGDDQKEGLDKTGKGEGDIKNNNVDALEPFAEKRVHGDVAAEEKPKAKEVDIQVQVKKQGGNAANASKSKREGDPIDALWDAMRRGLTKTKVEKKKPRISGSLQQWLGSGTNMAPKGANSVKIRRLVDLEEENRARAAAEREEKQMRRKRRETGLEGILRRVKGEKNGGMLEKSKEVWTEFKEGDEKVEQELEKYKKDKDRYTDRIAFLERADRKEWEWEQTGKRTPR